MPNEMRDARQARGNAGGAPMLVSSVDSYGAGMSEDEARRNVENNVGQRVLLSQYRPTIESLKPEERDILIEQAQLMLEQIYVHLPLKRALHGTEPVQRLRLLKLRHGRMSEREFQSAMSDIFIGLRDLHTNYLLPSSYRSKFAFLPFRIEEFYEANVRQYVVSWVSPVNPDPNLKAGVIVTHWNGSPTEIAVARNAEREGGSNPDARRARGIEALTLRWLGMSLPPDEDWVTLTYRDGSQSREFKFQWEIIDSSDRADLLASTDRAMKGSEARTLGLDLKTDLLQRARKAIFDPAAVHVEAQMSDFRKGAASDVIGAAPAPVPPPRADTSSFPDVYPRFGSVNAAGGPFGYIRLRTFAPQSRDVEGAVREFVRIVGLMPATGLILDVRGNGGGYINFGERILQTLTPHEITPEPFHFLATPLAFDVAAKTAWLGQWRDAIEQGIETGASFSQGFPLTPGAQCNDIGQVYQGPVVLITDALCYSTTDIFAAGFQDHQVGKIIGVHDNTGAGGANVWDHEQVLERLNVHAANPFVPLPAGAGMRVAARRATRIGARSGVPVEDLGVVPDIRYRMTLADVLNDNVDLIAFAAGVLAGMDKQTLRVRAQDSVEIRHLAVEAERLDRIDVLVRGRPVVSQDVTARDIQITLPTAVDARDDVRVLGYRGNNLVVTARLSANAQMH